MNGAAADRPLVGLFGAFDTGDLGEVALRRVVEGELRRRRPDIHLVTLAPFGSERPVPGDEGRPALPLPAGGLDVDALIITGDVLVTDSGWAERYAVAEDAVAERGVGALVTTGLRSGTPAAGQVIWFAVGAPDGSESSVPALAGRDVWVRDSATQRLIGGTVVQSGDPLLLASRIFEAGTLRRRADLLRMCGALPAGERLVVEVARGADAAALSEQVMEAVKAALRHDPALSLIVLTLNPTAPETFDPDLGIPLAAQMHRLPIWAGLDDIAAAISGASAAIATTSAGVHLAEALGTPVVAVEAAAAGRFAGVSTLEREPGGQLAALVAHGKPVDIADAVTTLDGAFAELAERLPRVANAAGVAASCDPTDSALAVLQQRLADERTALQAELSRLQAEIEHLQASPEHRLARPIREGYQRWQRRRT
ncbi:MAG TPA: hypothetical protein VI434_03485 [Candidatus Dormibacteraeota bacterium]